MVGKDRKKAELIKNLNQVFFTIILMIGLGCVMMMMIILMDSVMIMIVSKDRKKAELIKNHDQVF